MSNRTCKGCDHKFPTVRGYLSHLRQSRDILCQEIYRKIRTQGQDSSASDDSANSPHGANIYTREAVNFEGDVFGSAADYADDSFGQNHVVDPMDVDPDNIVPDEELNEDINDAMEAEMYAQLEDAWEMPTHRQRSTCQRSTCHTIRARRTRRR